MLPSVPLNLAVVYRTLAELLPEVLENELEGLF